MLCESCQSELEPVMVICPACGVRVRHGREEVDWRQQVRETVERHKAKRRFEQSRHDDEARQLTIFPETSERDEEDRAARARRAEIRARVEERLAKRPNTQPVGAGLEAGEVSLGGASAAAAMSEPVEEIERSIDPTTAAFNALEEVEVAGDSGADLNLGHAPGIGRDADAAAAAPEPFVAFGLATPGERILGGLIDLGFVSLIQLTLFYLTTHLVAQRLGALPTSAVVSMSLVGAVLGAGYFLFFWSLSGQTLGKLLTGSRVVDGPGGALGFRRAALRLVAFIASMLPLGAGFLGLWTDPERRGWHDRIAGTKVVRG